MLTKTTMTAIRMLVHVGLGASAEPLAIRPTAARLGESPTYLAKVAGLLVKAGILRAHRGVMGGVELNRLPADISLLDIVEACQGAILPDYCRKTATLTGVCGFHTATAELHEAIVGVMSRWTLAHFLRRPVPTDRIGQEVSCSLAVCTAAPARGAHPARRKHRKSTGRKRNAGA